MQRRFISGLLTAFAGFVLLAACGPVTVGVDPANPTPTPGDDDDDVVAGTFAITSSDTSISLHQGWHDAVTLTISSPDGFAGALDITAPTSTSGIDLALDKSTVNLNSTDTSVDVVVSLEGLMSDDGTTLEALGPVASAPFTFSVSDGVTTKQVDVNIEVTDYVFFKLGANIPAGSPNLFHENYVAPVGSYVYFVAVDANPGDDPALNHRIHGPGGNFDHQNAGVAMYNNLAYAPISGGGGSVDINDIRNADLSVGGLVGPYNAALTVAQNWYCHNHQANGGTLHGDANQGAMGDINPTLIIQ